MKKKSLLITAIAIFGFAIVSMAQTVPSYVPTSGLFGWWPFTGNANDSSGNGNNGTVNGATLTIDRFGNADKAYRFDGNDVITANSISFINLSVSIWYLVDSSSHFLVSDGHPPMGSQLIGQGTQRSPLAYCDYALGLSTFNGPQQIVFEKSTTRPPEYYEMNYSNNTFNYSNWVHLVLTVQGRNVSLYKNSILFSSFSASSAFQNIGSVISFGARYVQYDLNPLCNFFTGKLDDIGIWNRALDSCEIKDLYFASLGNCCHISISTQPLSQSVSISNNVQFTTSSDSSATYQWQTDLGVGFQNINSVGQYSGTTNDTLSVSSVTMSNNNQPFRCIIRSGSCYDTSDIAILNVCGAVTISPVNQNVVINNTAQFTTASTDPMATYQWQTDLGVGFQNINSVGQYSGTNKDTLRVANVTMGNNNQPFRCIVSSGACSDTSDTADLTVINANGINETSTNNLFTVYPNPAKSQINVKADASLIGSSYTVYNNIGKVTLTGKINAENTVLDLGHLSSGVYLFGIGDSLKQRFTVVKE